MNEHDSSTKNINAESTKEYFTCMEVVAKLNIPQTRVKRYADVLNIPLREGRRLFTAGEIERIRTVPSTRFDRSGEGLFTVEQVNEQTGVSKRTISRYATVFNIIKKNNRFYFTREDIDTMLSKTQRDLSGKGLYSTKQVAEKIGITVSRIIHYSELMKIPLQNGQYYYTQNDIDALIARREKYKAGKVYGYLTAVRDTGKTKLTREGKQSPVWEWKCKCGNTMELSVREVQRRKFPSCGCRRVEHGRKVIKNAAKGLKIYDGVNVSFIESKKLRRNNTSGVTGVSYITPYRKWAAYIMIKGTMHNLGRYETLEEAAEVRKRGEEKYFAPYIEGYYNEHKKKDEG